MQKKPYSILFEILSLFDKKQDKRIIYKNDKYKELSKQFVELEDIKPYKLNHEDVMIIAVTWYKYIEKRNFYIDPLKILNKLYSNPSTQIRKLEKIIALLKKNVFYTSKKEVFVRKQVQQNINFGVNFNTASLLQNDIEFHRSFLNTLLGKKVDISLQNQKIYTNNKEFLDDWFSYVGKLYDFSLNSFSQRGLNKKLEESEASEYLEVVSWRKRIECRMSKTTEVYPLIDLQKEYELDEKELTIIVHLIKEELEDRYCDSDELVKLISADVHEMYRNKEYVNEESKLVRKGLIELSQGVFFLSTGANVRTAPDIMRRIIMKTPVNDNERLDQILKNDDIFTLVEPTQNFEDLILHDEMKSTLKFSLNQYSSNVEKVLSEWGLYNDGLKQKTNLNRKAEPGMLMLFYGAPGTGKTFAAGAIAQALGKKLLITDISRIQSKWVGDSEKNVRRIFSVYERIVHRVDNPPVLLLNEADQFLMNRSRSASSSVDKMMNSMQNLFLEAFENLNGILIATTNLRDNLDEAFSRRFHLKLDFPMPDICEREKLWQLHLPDSIPGSDQIKITNLANEFRLTGGQIKIIVRNACAEAASRKGSFQILMQQDLKKYCELETLSNFSKAHKKIGFGA